MLSFTKTSTLALAAALCLSGTAEAATLSWSSYSSSDLAQAKADRAIAETDFQIALEDFETFSPVPVGGGAGTTTPLGTGVGVFTTTPGNACGGSCDAPDDQSLVRAQSGYGRYNTTDNGSKWLDSNDNAAINLAAATAPLFDSISFFLTDIDDVGPTTFSILVDGLEFDIAADIFNGNRQRNGGLFYVNIGFDSLVNSSALSLRIDDGDGFGIDDVRIGSSVAPVPIPATLPLLAAGLGAMGWAARRRKAA